jgi:hypothetical protein
MDEGSPMRVQRRGIRRWIWWLLASLPLFCAACLICINGWLASGSGCAWMARKIQARTGLEASIGRATILPWSGVIVYDMKLLQPPALRAVVKEPLFRMDSLQLRPVWEAWWQGKMELNSITLDHPRGVLPAELVADILRSRVAVQKANPAPPPAITAPPPPVAAPPALVTPPAVPQAPVSPSPVAPPPPAPAVEAPSLPLSPTGWIHVKNASFTVVAGPNAKAWFRVDGLSGSIPVSGGRAESAMEIRSIEWAGKPVLTDFRPVLEWQAPFLAVKPMEGKLSGWGDLNYQLAAKIGFLSGLPLQVEVRVPEQVPAEFQLSDRLSAKVGKLTANSRFRGLLLAPQTWQGDWVGQVKEISAKVGNHQASFDRGSGIVVLRGGVLSCVDARLVGDELSFLGNATALADGRVAAALRMVAPPGHVNGIVKRTFNHLTDPLSLTPLSTDQRTAFDLQAFGNFQQIFLRFGREGPVMRVKR